MIEVCWRAARRKGRGCRQGLVGTSRRSMEGRVSVQRWDVAVEYSTAGTEEEGGGGRGGGCVGEKQRAVAHQRELARREYPGLPLAKTETRRMCGMCSWSYSVRIGCRCRGNIWPVFNGAQVAPGSFIKQHLSLQTVTFCHSTQCSCAYVAAHWLY